MNSQALENQVCQWLKEAEEEEMRTHVLADLIYPQHTLEQHILLAETQIQINKQRFTNHRLY